MDPDGYAYGKRGEAHLAARDVDRAIADFTEAIRLNPWSYWAYEGRAKAYEVKGDREAAKKDRDRATELKPNRAKPPGPPPIAKS